MSPSLIEDVDSETIASISLGIWPSVIDAAAVPRGSRPAVEETPGKEMLSSNSERLPDTVSDFENRENDVEKNATRSDMRYHAVGRPHRAAHAFA